MVVNNFSCMSVLLVLFAFVPCPADAAVLVWDFSIDESQIKNGPEPDGSTNSSAFGSGHFSYDESTNILSYEISWNQLFGELTKLHLHGPADSNSSNPAHLVEIFGPPDIPQSVDRNTDVWTDSHPLEALQQSGTDPTTGLPYEPITPSEILAIMSDGLSYLNVHTNVFGVGEIRGNLGIPVPEPSAWGMMLLCGLQLMWRGRS